MLISVVIPCYNVEDYIEECVESAFNQTYTNTEIICVDNESIDTTWEKLKHLKGKYPDLIITKEPRKGAPAARNKGLKLSKGEWIQFLDADDLLLPEKIGHQAQLIENDVAFIAGAFEKVYINNSKKNFKISNNPPIINLFEARLGITSSNLWNSQWIKKIGGWNEFKESSQEAWLMFDLLKINEKVIYDNEVLTLIRERESGQISQQDIKGKWLRYLKLRLEILDWLKNSNSSDLNRYSKLLKDSIFNIVRQIARYNIAEAIEIKNRYLGKDYMPAQSNSRKVYRLFYRLLGFKTTEQLYQLIRKK